MRVITDKIKTLFNIKYVPCYVVFLLLLIGVVIVVNSCNPKKTPSLSEEEVSSQLELHMTQFQFETGESTISINSISNNNTIVAEDSYINISLDNTNYFNYIYEHSSYEIVSIDDTTCSIQVTAIDAQDMLNRANEMVLERSIVDIYEALDFILEYEDYSLISRTVELEIIDGGVVVSNEFYDAMSGGLFSYPTEMN